MNLDFRITRKFVKELLEVLDEVVEEIRKEEKAYPYAKWERKRGVVKERLRKLPEYVREACMINVQKKVGRPKKPILRRKSCFSSLQG